MPYALFDCNRKVGETLPSEMDVWKQAVEAGLISDVPVADEEGGQVLPPGYHVKEVLEFPREEPCQPESGWQLPREIS
jgi:hypothetical protein